LYINENSGVVRASVAQLFSTDFHEYSTFGEKNTTVSRHQWTARGMSQWNKLPSENVF